MAEKKKLLFVYEELNTGGSTTALVGLLQALDYAKYSVDLLCYRCPDPKALAALGIPKTVNILDGAAKYGKSTFSKVIKALHLSLSPSFYRAMSARRKGKSKYVVQQHMAYARVRLSKNLKSLSHYDAVIGYIEGWSNAYALSDKISADKRIVFIHLDYPASGLDSRIDTKAFARADAIVSVSDSCKDALISAFPQYESKAFTVRNVLYAEKVRALSEQKASDRNCVKYDFITVCRPDIYVKGLDRLAEAAARLKTDGFSFRWGLVGVPDDHTAFSDIIEKHGISDCVFPLGNKENPYPYFKLADWLVVTSRFEACPMVVTEAQMLALPCIVTHYASAAEQVSDGRNGLITENSTDGIYRALRSVLEDRAIRAQFTEELSSTAFSDGQTEAEELYRIIDGR